MLRIVIPAWNEPYVGLAKTRTVPSLLTALRGRPARFVFHTDSPQAFSDVPDAEFFEVEKHDRFHAAQAAAHRKSLAAAEPGDVVMLMNADVVVSADTFDQAEILLAGQTRCIACLGLRTLSKDGPPIGVDAKTLLDWSWKNRHPINEDCVWGRGRTSIPTLLFFEGPESVVANCFHLHPMFIRKERALPFAGTIDSDLLAQFRPGEVHTVCDREMAFAEMSPASKMFRRTHSQVTALDVIRFGRNRFTPSHIEFFKKTIRITGVTVPNNTIIHKIARGLAR